MVAPSAVMAAATLACVLGRALAAPNTYQVLAGHQVWQVEGGARVVRQLRDSGLVDLLYGSAHLQHLRVAPQHLQHVRDTLAPLMPRVLVPDLALHLQEREHQREGRSVAASHQSCTAASCPAPLTHSYMNLTQIEYYLKEVARSSPRVELTSIGKSFEGRDVWMVHVAPPETVNKEEEDGGLEEEQPAVWVEGGIHAREWVAPAATLHLLHRLLQNPLPPPAPHVFLVPMANPDGYAYSWSHDRLWRKNRRAISGSPCVGIDLNRNWGIKWGEYDSSNDPCAENYQGYSAFSEAETKSLSDKMKEISAKRKLLLVLSVHSYGQTIVYPWAWTNTTTPDTPAMHRVAQAFADGIQRSDGRNYTVNNACNEFYPVSGVTCDWAKEQLGVRHSLSVELRPVNTPGFMLHEDEIEATGEELWRGFSNMIPLILREKDV